MQKLNSLDQIGYKISKKHFLLSKKLSHCVEMEQREQIWSIQLHNTSVLQFVKPTVI